MSGSILKSPITLPDPPSPELACSANTCDVPLSSGNNLFLPTSSWKTDGEGRSAHIHQKPSKFHIPHSPPKDSPSEAELLFLWTQLRWEKLWCSRVWGLWWSGNIQGRILAVKSCSSQHLCKPTQGICRNQVIWH